MTLLSSTKNEPAKNEGPSLLKTLGVWLGMIAVPIAGLMIYEGRKGKR